MRKLITILAAILAFICNSEILTLLFITAGVVIFALFILGAWAKTEKPKLPGSFDSDWGKK